MALFSKRAQIPGIPGLFGAGKEEENLKGELGAYEAKAREKEIEALREEAETYGEEFQKINEFIGEYSQRLGHDLEKEAEGVAAEATVVGAAGGAMDQALGANDITKVLEVVAGLKKTRDSLQKKIKDLNKRLVDLNAEPISVPGMGGGLFGGGGISMPHVSSKTAGTIFKVVVVVALLAVVGFYLFFTNTGALATSESAGLFADLKNSLRGVAAPISIAEQVITGKYDPTQLWNSKTYEDKYTSVQDVGVEVSDIKSLQDTYAEGPDTIPTIVGTIKVTALPEDPDTKITRGVDVTISANWEKGLVDKIKENIQSIAARATGSSVPSENWECTRIPVSVERFVGRFQCFTIGAYTVAQPIETHSADVNIAYDFKAVSGKAVYVANFDDMSRMLLENKDPVSEYKLTSSDLSSWQTKSPLDVGMGIVGEQGVIGANSGPEGNNPTPYFLGVSIVNMGDGRATPETLELRVPQSVMPVPTSDNDFKNVRCDEKLGDETLCVYTIDLTAGPEGVTILKPGESVTKYFKFMVSQDTFLNGAPISSFFVLANVDFGYTIQRTVPIKIRQVGTS
jgi:hypothetical protein